MVCLHQNIQPHHKRNIMISEKQKQQAKFFKSLHEEDLIIKVEY